MHLNIYWCNYSYTGYTGLHVHIHVYMYTKCYIHVVYMYILVYMYTTCYKHVYIHYMLCTCTYTLHVMYMYIYMYTTCYVHVHVHYMLYTCTFTVVHYMLCTCTCSLHVIHRYMLCTCILSSEGAFTRMWKYAACPCKRPPTTFSVFQLSAPWAFTRAVTVKAYPNVGWVQWPLQASQGWERWGRCRNDRCSKREKPSTSKTKYVQIVKIILEKKPQDKERYSVVQKHPKY